jgi:predicted SnoaL-like aldol condensation-catalyzing enzyme
MNTKEMAIDFLQLASSGRVDEAYDLYVGKNFRHHNPYFAGNAQALKEGMRDNALKNPGKVCDVQRTIVEGPLVAVHSRIQMAPGKGSVAVVHIFRMEGGKIAELWDVGQQVPDSAVNEYGMF